MIFFSKLKGFHPFRNTLFLTFASHLTVAWPKEVFEKLDYCGTDWDEQLPK